MPITGSQMEKTDVTSTRKCTPGSLAGYDMKTQRHDHIVLAACLLLIAASGVSLVRAAASPIPAKLEDQQFWSLSKDSSEEDGYFRSDNLLSNETTFQYIIPDLLKT